MGIAYIVSITIISVVAILSIRHIAIKNIKK